VPQHGADAVLKVNREDTHVARVAVVHHRRGYRKPVGAFDSAAGGPGPRGLALFADASPQQLHERSVAAAGKLKLSCGTRHRSVPRPEADGYTMGG